MYQQKQYMFYLFLTTFLNYDFRMASEHESSTNQTVLIQRQILWLRGKFQLVAKGEKRGGAMKINVGSRDWIWTLLLWETPQKPLTFLRISFRL